MTTAVLTLNAGSSSLKFALFRAGDDPAPETMAVLARGQVEGVGSRPRLRAVDAVGAEIAMHQWPSGEGLTPEDFVAAVYGFCGDHLGSDRIAAVGHRIVHGGDRFARPARLTPEVMDALEALDPLAPLHQPHNLAAVRAAVRLLPNTPQVGLFDTAFHQTLPATARRFGLPRALEAKGVRRFGFHGLSYAWLSRRLASIDPDLAAGRVIYAHLGAGASLCATRGGASLDTTMGFTALDGLVMATRCGALDPGVVLHLISQEGYAPERMMTLLYSQSGLLGVSGLSGDMRVLLASDRAEAAEAVDLFIYRIAREIGALAMSLGGLEGLVFSAGVGENAAAIRAGVAQKLGWMGLSLDDPPDGVGERRISSPDSRIRAYVIPTDEERVIAAGALSVLLTDAARPD